MSSILHHAINQLMLTIYSDKAKRFAWFTSYDPDLSAIPKDLIKTNPAKLLRYLQSKACK